MTDAATSEALRRMVREVLREVLPAQAATDSAPGDDVRRVRVRDDRDLSALVTQILNLAQDPDRAADLRSGRIRFRLAGESGTGAPAGPAPLEVERGAVTERVIQQAAREQRPLRIGPRAVVTPLARDRARALGVQIHRTEAAPGRETR